MRYRWYVCLLLLTGCLPTLPEEPTTAQVASSPFTEPRRAAPTRVSYAPASQQTSYRVLLIKDALVNKNPQLGINPYIIAIGSADPEIFHVGLNHVYITEGLFRQCQTEGQLAAVLANELGRIISEREAATSDDIRSPERLLPIQFSTAGSGRDRDPIGPIELALHEKRYPKQHGKLGRPNPQLIAREVLERAGYQRTDLDSVLPILQNAERFQVLENQFKGAPKQSDWKTP